MSIYFKQHIFIIISLTFFVHINHSIFGQKVIEYGIQINPGMTVITKNQNTGFTDINLKGSYNINFGLTASYYLNKQKSIYTGIRLYSANFKMTCAEYATTYKTTDSEEQPYERIVNGSNIYESSKLTMIQIPVCFKFEKVLSRSLRIFVLAGPAFSFPIKCNTTAKGLFTYKGYYKEGNYTLEDIPVYGFNSNVPLDVNEKMDNHIIAIQGMASVGCSVSLSRYWKAEFSACYVRSVTPELKNNQGKYSLSTEIGSYHSVLSGNKVILHDLSLGISIKKVLLF